MSTQSLQEAIDQVGSPTELLRNSTIRPHTFPVAPEFTNWRSEQASWRTTCALLDQSHHMTDLIISGPDALKLFSDFGVNTFKNFVAYRAKQYVAVNADGYLIGDAILFHLPGGIFDLVGHPTTHNWLQYNAEVGNYDVTIERDENSFDRAPGRPPKFYRYELQGPTSPAIMELLTGAPVPEVKFFHMVEFSIAGHTVFGLRHGMAGQPGFELFGPWEDGADVLAAILEVGADHGLVRVGAKAYSTANLESAWVPSPPPAIFGDDMQAYREWLPLREVGSFGGSQDTGDISDTYLTPYDIGYGPSVKFDHDFYGRQALEEMADGPHRTKVTLVWNPEDWAAAIQSLAEPGTPAKYIEMPKSRYALHQADQVLRDGAQVGISLDLGYIANEHAYISLACVDADSAVPGTEVVVVWGESPNTTKPAVEEHRQVQIRATVAQAPYSAAARETYRKS
ncbi:MAG: aminomethyl transferase family protein [Phycicoccus sp.]|nr:aminomethyl transferase family protein [Phycicoccus sp.]